MSVRKIPEGYHTVTPYLNVRRASDAIAYYKEAFGAEEVMRLEHQGMVGHAEVRIGDSHVMLADEYPDIGAVGPETLGGAGVHMMIYVDDVDSAFAQAIAAGGNEVRPVADQFYGDRCGTLKDPFGHQWTLATHIEEVSDEELQKRFEAMFTE